MTIRKTSSHGHYIVRGNVNGFWLECKTTNSEAFDYLLEKGWFTKEDYAKHDKAQDYCKELLKSTYLNKYQP